MACIRRTHAADRIAVPLTTVTCVNCGRPYTTLFLRVRDLLGSIGEFRCSKIDRDTTAVERIGAKGIETHSTPTSTMVISGLTAMEAFVPQEIIVQIQASHNQD